MRVVTAKTERPARIAAFSQVERQRAHLEGLALAAVAIVVLFGVWLATRQHAAIFEAARGDAVINLNLAGSPSQLAPVLGDAAQAVFDWKTANGPLTHVGALAGLRLLTTSEITAIKPSVVVRSEREYTIALLGALGLLLFVVVAAHLTRRVTGRTGDPVLLPAVLLLVGLSVMTMISMRDPLRDTVPALGVIYGAIAGCMALTALAFVDFEDPRLKRATLLPFATAVALAAALLVFGSGPGSSGAKVNLFGMQPIEIIRLLALFALASYFARRWEGLREISQPVGPGPMIRRRFSVPRLRDIQPLAVIVGTLLVFFVLQKDLGPALVLGSMALAMYGVARSRAGLVLAGFGVLLAGFGIGYWIGIPSTLARRVAIWLEPWHNGLVGGDQIAHAQWAMATGGAWGLGPGVGDGHLIPAGHTDLIAAAIGEELGLIGLVAIAAVYLLIIWRIARTAVRAPGDYTAFLALGCALALAVPAIVIVGGVLGLLPLSGVVTPFLSFGKSSMIANMIAVGIVLSIARRSSRARPAFVRETRTLTVALAAIAIVLAGRLAWVQVFAADAIALRPSLVRQADGGARYQYNPRLLAAARMIPRGTIFDRNGLPLAVNAAADAKPMFDRLAAVRAATGVICDEKTPRCYPLGGYGFHVIGDAPRQTNWAAPNAAFVEEEAAAALQGFDDRAETVQVTMPDGTAVAVVARDYRPLLPLLRGKGTPDHPDVRRLLDAKRDITITLDGPFQALVARALELRAREAGSTRGAAVVLNADTGEVLASVSYPWPAMRDDAPVASTEQLLDRARFGLYPPGSTFKLITAAAALSASPPDRLPTFECVRLPDGRVGAQVAGVGRPIRDDVLDHTPHGVVDLRRGLIVSCNAYFARLAMHTGAGPLAKTAAAAGIQPASEPAMENLERTLPFAGYGQGQVLARPIHMARVVSAIAGDGMIRERALVKTRPASREPVRLLTARDAALLRSAMREIVTSGTARTLASHPIAISGKTGTAEVTGATSHSWFAGFAPSNAPGGARIAFAVIIEHGGYGGRAAAAAGGDIVTAARTAGVIR